MKYIKTYEGKIKDRYNRYNVDPDQYIFVLVIDKGCFDSLDEAFSILNKKNIRYKIYYMGKTSSARNNYKPDPLIWILIDYRDIDKLQDHGTYKIVDTKNEHLYLKIIDSRNFELYDKDLIDSYEDIDAYLTANKYNL